MGLLITINSKGFDEVIYDSGYDGFTKFRIELAKSKDLKCDYSQHNYVTDINKNQLEVFNRALLYCWKHKVNMWFK